MSRPLLPSALLVATLLASCAHKAETKKEEPSPFGPTGIPPELRAKTPGETEAGTPVIAGGNMGNGKYKATAESDIVYTDPDNPDAAIPELATVLSNATRGPWEESETIAKQRSIREGKPMLIWFTDSLRSPMCKAVSQELFSRTDFGDWAKDKLVRLKVDVVVSKDPNSEDLGSAEDRRARIQDYNEALKKRYKIMGYPSLVVVSPSGEVVGRYRGYQRGEADLLWGQIKHAEAVSSEAYKGWKSGLEKKGYRHWKDRRGRQIFAKLASYSNGTLVLIEPEGGRAQTKETSLSDEDRAWIATQKKLRGLQ